MMPTWLSAVLVGLWVAWGAQAVLSAVLVARFWRRLHKQPHPPGKRTFLATVIVPFKGVDTDLHAAVQGLCTQVYPNYRLIFVVESAQDPAYSVLREALARHPQRDARILESGVSGPEQGQKVHNQLRAIESLLAEPAADPHEVWVFADSDAVPHQRWLGDLIARLREVQKTAVTTGYRWLVPTSAPGRRPTIWSHLASLMNASVTGFLGRDQFNHAWGGSMALRRDTAVTHDLPAYLRGALTDDYQLTRLARDLGRRVYFVESCLVPSPVDFTFGELLNFTYRQYLLTRVYAPWLFAGALGVTTLYAAGAASAWAALGWALTTRQPAQVWLLPVAAMAVVLAANQVRASFRRRVIRDAFGADMLERLRATLRLDRWATTLWMLAHWLVVLRAAFGRRMRWRGIDYDLRGPQHVRRVS